MTKLVISGRLRAGKDYVAEQMRCRAVAISDPMYLVSEHFLGTSDKDLPHVRRHLQLIGAWGRCFQEPDPEGLPSRETVTNFMRTMGRDFLPAEYRDIAWDRYGKDPDFWVTATRLRVDRMIEDSPATPVAITNARFLPEIESFQSIGFNHLHVQCSTETRMARAKRNYDPKLDQHPGEQMAIDFDKPGALNDRKVVWNDHLAPPAGSNFLSVQEAVAQYTKLSLPSAPDQSHMGAAMTVNHALA